MWRDPRYRLQIVRLIFIPTTPPPRKTQQQQPNQTNKQTKNTTKTQN